MEAGACRGVALLGAARRLVRLQGVRCPPWPLQVNVFVLGMVFQQIVKLLNMESNAMLARCATCKYHLPVSSLSIPPGSALRTPAWSVQASSHLPTVQPATLAPAAHLSHIRATESSIQSPTFAASSFSVLLNATAVPCWWCRPIDPCLYVHRFAARLDFKERMWGVTQTALQLIKSMKRDWIQTGRRPAGVCGAALFIAAHVHGVRAQGL